MSKKSAITGSGPNYGNNVPFSKKKTRRRWDVNLHDKKVWVPELKKYVKIRVSTRDMRSIDKHGLLPYLASNGLSIKDIA